MRRKQAPETDEDGAPLLSTAAAFEMPMPTGARSRKKSASGGVSGRGTAGQVTSRRGTINLKSVAQACIDEGLDPASEIARVLCAKVPALNRAGNVIMAADGKPLMVDMIDPETKVRTLTELLQYNQPKLKAVEMKVSGTLEMSSEEIDARLAALLAKAVK